MTGGCMFWGLFPVFGLLVAAYVAWMRKVEREEDRRRGDP